MGFLRQIILTASRIVKEKDAQSIGRGGPPSALAIGNCSHEKDEKPTRDACGLFSLRLFIPAATYSPTQLPTQYHRRWRA